MIVDISRARVTHPGGVEVVARFVFRDGIAAVWVERVDGRRKFAEQVLFAAGSTFVRAETARSPHVLTTASGDEWFVVQNGQGGCGCASPLKGMSLDQLLTEAVTV